MADDAAPVVDKQGFIELKDNNAKKAKTKAVWCVLIDGTLHTYKTPLDATPLGKYDLKGMKLEEKSEGKGKGKGKGKKKTKAGFTVTFEGQKSVVEFSCVNDEDRENWVEVLKENESKDPSEPPTREQGKRHRGSLMFRAKKSVGGKAATSGMGKGMMKRLADDDTKQLLTALKKVVGKYFDEKRANEIENSIIKLAVKCYFLVENKSLSSESFLDVDGPIRSAFELISKIYDKMHRVNEEALREAFGRVSKDLQKTESVLEGLLLPYVKQKTLQRLKDTFSCLSNPKFLFAVFQDEELEDEIHDLVKAMEYYTQFHVYKDKKKDKK